MQNRNVGPATYAVLVFPLLIFASGCAPEEPPLDARDDVVTPGIEPGPAGAPVPEAALERARSAASALGGDLQRELLTALEAGGPLLAVEVCSAEAQEISRTHSTQDLSVRRVSLRTRNPLNDPDSYELERLEALASAHARDELPTEESEVVVEDGVQVLRLMRPIVIAEPCLACHGDPQGMDPSVLELIRAGYPEDRAVGYRAGDLRGAVSVRVLLSADDQGP
jgi:hypothetical protein